MTPTKDLWSPRPPPALVPLDQGRELGVLRMAAGLQHSAQGMDRVMQQCGNFLDTQPGAPELQWEMLVPRG